MSRRGLRIGIDATSLAAGRGYARYLRELLHALFECDRANDYLLFTDAAGAPSVEPGRARVIAVATSQPQAQAASARSRRRLRDLWRMGRAVARARLDLMFFPSVYSFYPVPGRTPVLVGFHDTIPEDHGRLIFPNRRARWAWCAKAWLARRRATALLTVSEWSRAQLAQRFGLAAERIFVTPEAPSPVFTPVDDPAPRRKWFEARGIPADAPYLIYVGGFNPHKNLPRLIEAFAAATAGPGERARLLLVGDAGGDLFHADLETLRRAIEAAGIGERVHTVGFVPDSDLRHLYAGARALVLPSLEEGFGLPAVEAAACGTPCVATRRSPLPELLAGGGLFVDPEDSVGLREALERILADHELRVGLGRVACERAARLSWQRAAEAALRAFRAVAEESA